MRGTRPTISDVARHAGVSKATVSAVLNDTGAVKDATRDRVLSAIALLLGGCHEGRENALRTVAGGDAERGRAAIVRYGCGGCHTIPGVPGARARVGPPLTDFADRQYVAGKLANQPEHVMRWIRDPQAVSPGTAMPDLNVTEPAARDIAAYLYTLGGGGLGPPHLLPQELLPQH